tara:strand:+ start:113 stop:277 length:165 start_codon:yes stop_codon:yes gene_type:complete
MIIIITTLEIMITITKTIIIRRRRRRRIDAFSTTILTRVFAQRSPRQQCSHRGE